MMFSRRSARLLLLAVVIATGFLYLSWRQPFAWDAYGDLPTENPPTIPQTDQTNRHANHGTAPVGASNPESPPASNPDDGAYDFKRPTNAEEAGFPSVPAGKPNTAADLPQAPAPAPVQPQAQEPLPKPDCPPSFETYMRSRPGPKSAGSREFPLVRPAPECRTFTVPAVEEYIKKMETTIKDPDLYRLFQNSFPNTLDTMVKWHGYAQDADGNQTTEELSDIITGDIDAMWLRDSASQLYSYLSFLAPDRPEGRDELGSLNSLWRGLINSHARYILISPYCHAFQPPPESGIPPTHNGAYKHNNPRPAYDPTRVFDCKWELDSLASFLQVSVGYWDRTHDLAFFARHRWVDAVRAAVDAAAAMRLGTYDDEGRVLPSAWTFTGWTNRGSETLTNDGLGNPVRTNGMVRTAFRPSDDATIFQLLVPANMMWAKYLEEASVMMQELAEGAVHPINPDTREAARGLARDMRDFALGVRRGIDRDAVVPHREYGDIFAYECDGFGGVNLMDDANVPSLLSMPLFDYATPRFPTTASKTSNEEEDKSGGAALRSRDDYRRIYRNTRRFALSPANPYYARGPAISAVGGPHLGPGKAWPMAALVAGMTAFDVDTGLVDSRGKVVVGGEGGSSAGAGAAGSAGAAAAAAKKVREVVAEQLGMVLDSTTGYGVVHESVNSWNGNSFTRAWFGWANGLLGELIMRIEEFERRNPVAEEESLLGRSWQ